MSAMVSDFALLRLSEKANISTWTEEALKELGLTASQMMKQS